MQVWAEALPEMARLAAIAALEARSLVANVMARTFLGKGFARKTKQNTCQHRRAENGWTTEFFSTEIGAPQSNF
ncbi:MAG TPA: hypothetical protein VGL59_06690 [Polyangia bacterium]